MSQYRRHPAHNDPGPEDTELPFTCPHCAGYGMVHAMAVTVHLHQSSFSATPHLADFACPFCRAKVNVYLPDSWSRVVMERGATWYGTDTVYARIMGLSTPAELAGRKVVDATSAPTTPEDATPPAPAPETAQLDAMSAWLDGPFQSEAEALVVQYGSPGSDRWTR